jgi:hypothetical protein
MAKRDRRRRYCNGRRKNGFPCTGYVYLVHETHPEFLTNPYICIICGNKYTKQEGLGLSKKHSDWKDRASGA